MFNVQVYIRTISKFATSKIDDLTLFFRNNCFHYFGLLSYNINYQNNKQIIKIIFYARRRTGRKKELYTSDV